MKKISRIFGHISGHLPLKDVRRRNVGFNLFIMVAWMFLMEMMCQVGCVCPLARHFFSCIVCQMAFHPLEFCPGHCWCDWKIPTLPTWYILVVHKNPWMMWICHHLHLPFLHVHLNLLCYWTAFSSKRQVNVKLTLFSCWPLLSSLFLS